MFDPLEEVWRERLHMAEGRRCSLGVRGIISNLTRVPRQGQGVQPYRRINVRGEALEKHCDDFLSRVSMVTC